MNGSSLFDDLPSSSVESNSSSRSASRETVPDADLGASEGLANIFEDLPEAKQSLVAKPANKELDCDGENKKRQANDESFKEPPVKRVAMEVPVDQDSVQSKPCIEGRVYWTEALSGAKHEIYCAAAERRGERDCMQDTHIIIHDLWTVLPSTALKAPSCNNRPRLSLVGVFDGHAGVNAAEFVANNLPALLLTNLCAWMDTSAGGLDEGLSPKVIKKCIVDTYKQLDSDFLLQARKEKWKDGCTAVTMLIVADDVYVANLGDSGAVLARCQAASQNVDDPIDFKPVNLTKSHNPSVYEERVRIQKAGGTVKDGRVMGVLEVSRSFGDGQFKSRGVVCVPSIISFKLTGQERFVVLGCDGLWATVARNDAIAFVAEYMNSQVAKTSVENLLDQQ
eukprot:Ihof_evm2s285 gene=Ihof_evmTU2s285